MFEFEKQKTLIKVKVIKSTHNDKFEEKLAEALNNGWTPLSCGATEVPSWENGITWYAILRKEGK